MLAHSLAIPLLLAVSSFVFLFIAPSQPALADAPGSDVAAGNAIVQRALTAAQSGNLTLAKQQYQAYNAYWPSIEDGVRAASSDDYRAIEARMRDVDAAFVPNPPNAEQVANALASLDQAQRTFITAQGGTQAAAPSSAPATGGAPAIAGAPAVGGAQPSGSTQTTPSTATVSTLIQQLGLARAAADKGDYPGAAEQVKAFQNTWPDVEGQIKTRSATAYSQTEDDMGLAMGLLNERSPESKVVLSRMYTRLQPFGAHAQYGVFDAAIILLREGLEALLVLVALLAVLSRSGNSDRRGWIWGGAAAGLLLSLALGVALNIALRGVMNPGNRELIEGVTGLVAATMLLYVSYWLHSNTSMSGWQRQIHRRTAQALTTGSLVGLATLSFLAVFREGAESVLFFLGMAADISTSDLLLGLAIGAAGLVVLGTLIMVIGVRIPMRPFFAVAGLLVFYLCFKFLGTGLHALQIAGVLPASSATYLPASDWFGLSPTWQTTIPQLLLLILAASVVLEGWVKQRRLPSSSGAAGVAAE
ncbi:MAG TPA: FTR1 family protein [Dehalococcoidia bacterium]|nr:FTR1 family protein [Dehalococcoidia bacterium]